MISKQSIDDIFTTARVEEVIGDFVQLKKSGSNYKGLSPFSDEKSPSFMVSPAKQIWKDFSSGKGGNVVSFLMEHEQFTYPEALKWLAKRYNIQLQEEQSQQTQEQKQELQTKESLFLVTEFAKKFFINQLNDTQEGKNIAQSYFTERGFLPETINTFQLGYSPKEWRAFADHATQKGYSKELLDKSGLVIYKEDNQYFDRFRERVIFPIQSFSGRTLGFGARILKDNTKAAKYLNSPENEIYHKSKILYGVYQAKQAILQQNECLLVEGYTDVISLHQAGIKNVVASSGTALTPDQIRLIKRLTPNVTLLYDGDTAGIKASFRGIDLILEQELNIKVLLLPEGEDPDSFAQKHKQTEIESYIQDNATDFIQFKTKVLLNETQDNPVKKAEIIRDIVQSIALIPNLIQRELYLRQTAKLLDISEQVLFKDIANLQQQKQRQEQRKSKPTPALSLVKQAPTQPQVNPLWLLEEELFKLILQHGNKVLQHAKQDTKSTVAEEIIYQIKQDNLELTNPIYQKAIDFVGIGLEENQIRTSDFFLRIQDDELNQLASNMVLEQHKISPNWEDRGIYIKSLESKIEKRLEDTLLKFKLHHLKDIIQNKSIPLKDPNISGDAREEILNHIMQLNQYKNKIQQHLNLIT